MHPDHVYGIDVDKHHLTVNTYGEESVAVIDNAAASIKDWLKTLPAGSWIGVESTSHYHETVARLGWAAGHRVYVLNARDVKNYACGIGRRGKTDKVDARVIARYVAKEGDQLHPYAPPSAAQCALRDLQQQRSALVSANTTLRQALTTRGALPAGCKPLMRELTKQLAAVDRQIHDKLMHDDTLKGLYLRLMTVPGIGPVVAACLAYHLERLPLRHLDAWIACTGLDPRPSESGQKKGRRRLSKRGPGILRKMLYMAAMSFARHALGQPLYQRYRLHKQLSSTAAYNILARLIARVAWALKTSGNDFDPAAFLADHTIGAVMA